MVASRVISAWTRSDALPVAAYRAPSPETITPYNFVAVNDTAIHATVPST